MLYQAVGSFELFLPCNQIHRDTPFSQTFFDNFQCMNDVVNIITEFSLNAWKEIKNIKKIVLNK